MTIHREGRFLLTVLFIFFVFLNFSILRLSNNLTVCWVVFSVSLVLFLIVLQFFRYPKRKIEKPDDNEVYSPADGKIVVIERVVETEYFKDERLMISIFMSPINVHSNHHPIGGDILYKKHHRGKYLVAWHPKSSTENERTTTVYQNGDVKILTRQIAGALAKRIINYVSKGDKVEQGGEMGFIKFGSRVDVFLPTSAIHKVAIGQSVKAKIDILATLT